MKWVVFFPGRRASFLWTPLHFFSLSLSPATCTETQEYNIFWLGSGRVYSSVNSLHFVSTTEILTFSFSLSLSISFYLSLSLLICIYIAYPFRIFIHQFALRAQIFLTPCSLSLSPSIPITNRLRQVFQTTSCVRNANNFLLVGQHWHVHV